MAEVFRLIAHAEPSLAQIPHSHFTFLEALRLQGTPDQQAFFYGLVREGALFADWLIVRASITDELGAEPTSTSFKALAFIPRDATGLEVVDDWDGMGQRTTASGTVILDDVEVPVEHVLPCSPIFGEPTV